MNALRLFDEFVQATIKHPDAAALRGLERRFAERLQIQPSYWSQIKGRSRQIGERLARQFEQCCGKPAGWLDRVHRLQNANTKGRVGYCLDPVDLFLSKAVAGREKDRDFCIALLAHGHVTSEQALALVSTMPIEADAQPRAAAALPDRLPPGQYLTDKFPVLHYGSVPRTDLKTWDFKVYGDPYHIG
mgnify:CR=1 FL=1